MAAPLLPVEEAQQRVLEGIEAAPLEWLPLDAALWRVLAEPVRAGRDQPPAAVSAMDGYAVRASEALTGTRLRLCGESRAGEPAAGALEPGGAVRIFTGAHLPKGADAVLIQEDATREGAGVRVDEAPEKGHFVRPRGLDFARGDELVPTGTLLDPRKMALVAAAGQGTIAVRQRPRVALLATGDELRRPGETPEPHEITSANLSMLAAMVRAWGGVPVDGGIVRDEPKALAAALEQAAACEFIVTTGGASVGEHDLVRAVGREIGLELDFWKIAMRPGKPLISGRLGGKPLLGLPGNPVSAAVCGIVFLRGMIRKRLTLDPRLPLRRLPLARDMAANGERTLYARGRWVRAEDRALAVAPAGDQDSSRVATFANADVLIIRPSHAPAAQAGGIVTAIVLDNVLSPTEAGEALDHRAELT